MKTLIFCLAVITATFAQTALHGQFLDITPTPSTTASPVNDTCQSLGHAFTYAILAYSTITNTGPSVVTGNVGIHPDDLSSITGFPPGIITGTVNAANNAALLAQNSLITAITTLSSLACGTDKTGVDLGGLVLSPGVYCFDTSAAITGILTLDAQGDPNALFVFQIGSTLTVTPGSSVLMINGSGFCNVYWDVGTSATLNTNSNFLGNILAMISITVDTGATVHGRLLAHTGAVTLQSNDVTVCATCTPNAELTTSISTTPTSDTDNDDSAPTSTVTSTSTDKMVGWVFVLVAAVILAVVCTGFCIPVLTRRRDQ
jgi:Ice-binding-like